MKNLSNEKINYIYHIADIHIRNSPERNIEYEEVFNELYNQLQNEPKGIICICGDIYHSKSQLSSESLMMFHKLMKISELMPVIIIAGNHDGSTVNNTLKDSILGSIHKYEKDVYYLNETGLYKYGDIIFSIKHFFDNKPLIKASEIQSNINEYKIALYHGALEGSKYDNGQNIEGDEIIKISSFEGFDYVLLGDIHKYQTFKNNTIAYSSSLIQQNYGEELYNHGYIKWNLDEEKMEFKRIKNNYGFIIIKMNDGKYEKINYPKNIKLRIYYKNTTQNQIDNLLIELQLKYNVIIDDIIEEVEYNNITNMDILLNKFELYDRMIEKYINKNLIDTDIKNEVKEKLNEVLGNVKEIITTKYDIKILEISNMFCYGEKNIIDFTIHNNIIGLFSKNYTGKSSIIDCIMEVLYDTNSRGLSNKELIRNGQKSGYIKLLISLNGIDYEINKKYKLSGSSIELIEKKTNKILNGDTNSDTINKIKQMFPNIDIFKGIHCILQGDNNGITELTQEKRLKNILDALGINDTQKQKELMVEKRKYLIKDNDENIKQIEKYPYNEKEYYEYIKKNKLLSKELIEFQNNINEVYKKRNKIKMNNIPNIDYKIEILNKEKENIIYTKELDLKIDLNNSIQIEVLDDNILIKHEKIIETNNKIRNNLYSKKTDLISSKYKINNIKDDIYEKKHKINEYINELKDKQFKTIYKQITDINEDDIKNIEDDIKKYNENNIKEKRLEKINLCRYNDNCNICIENNIDIIEEKNIIIDEINEFNKLNINIIELTKKYDKLQLTIKNNMNNEKENIKIGKIINDIEKGINKYENELEMINKQIIEYEENKEKNKKNKEIDKLINDIDIQIKNLDNQKDIDYERYKLIKKGNEIKIKQKEKYVDEINKIKKKINDNNNEIDKFKINIKLNEENNENEIIHKKLENELNDLILDINDIKNEMDSNSNEIKTNELHKKYNEFYNEKIIKNNRELKITKVLEVAYDYNGFTKLIIDEIIPNMEYGISKITREICGYNVKIDDKINIHMIRNGISNKINCGSGSEKLIINIAFRLMMSEYGLTLCKSNMMMIDESFISFDFDHRAKIPLIINEICKRYDKVFIISHMDELNNLIFDRINIFKKYNISNIL